MAKKAKLNPASHMSAKDVMDENERKRRREDKEGEDLSDIDAPGKEKPLEGLKPIKAKVQKQKAAQDVHTPIGDNLISKKVQPPKRSKEERAKDKERKRKEKKEKLVNKEERQKAKKAKKAVVRSAYSQAETEFTASSLQGDAQDVITQAETDDEVIVLDNDIEPVDVTGLVPDSQLSSRESASASPVPGSTFSHTSPQSTSSNSSVVPPATEHPPRKFGIATATPSSTNAPTKVTTDGTLENRPGRLPKIDTEALKARLQAKLEAYRAARNADGLNGKPAKNRAELIEARRLKQEKRKQHKKDLRKEAKEAEKKAEMEAELARMRGSPSIGSDMFSKPTTPLEPNSFSFGRVAFKDGQSVNSSLSGLVDGGKKKGPMDARQALLAAEKKKVRLASLDDVKRADIEEKDVWLNAKKKVHGERVRDDTSLLKKTLKRKEKTKLKSEVQWNERIEGVKKGQEFKQKKRENNIAKRKEEKSGKGAKKSKPSPKKKNRAGFEGSFRGRSK